MLAEQPIKKITETKEIKIMPGDLYATFWQRILAIGIDYLLLTMLGWFLLATGSNFFSRLGENGWWIGYLIAGAYFIWGYSSFGQGQTIGKKIMKISVINSKGGYLDTTSAALRYLIISLILFYPQILTTFFVPANYNLIFQIICFISILAIFLGMALFSGLGSKKRGIHDYIAASYVAKNNTLNILEGKEIQKITGQKDNNLLAWILFLILLLFFGSIFAVTIKFAELDKISYENFCSIKTKLEQDPDFKNVQIIPDFYVSSGEIKRNLFISPFIVKKDFEDTEKIKELKDKIKDLCYKKIKNIKEYRKITINFRTGIDLGLASKKDFKKIEEVITTKKEKGE